MKDFRQVLEGKVESKKRQANDNKESASPSFKDKVQSYSIRLLVPAALSLITAPFTTISIMLQITDKPLFDSYKIKMKANPTLQKYIESGLLGGNKIFRAAQFYGYSDAMRQLARQGIKSFYKGNMIGLIFALLNTKGKAQLYQHGARVVGKGIELQQLMSMVIIYDILALVTATIIDFLTLPLMASQSRLILQNIYQSAISVWKKASLRTLFAGSSLLVAKNIVFVLSWKKMIKESPMYSFVLSTLLSHVTMYPFITIIRQLQTCGENHPMMHDRKENIRQCVVRIWTTQGIRGFYRGFLGYAAVHSFMGLIILEGQTGMRRQ